MSKLRKHRSSFTGRGIDHLAAQYLNLQLQIEELKRELLGRCRLAGYTPLDAPKTKMLAGKLYEVLASRATRTDVDQKKARWLEGILHGGPGFGLFFERRTVYDLAENWERNLAQVPRLLGRKRHLRASVEKCLVRRSSRRLTVRKKTSAPSHGVAKKSQSARAARKAA